MRMAIKIFPAYPPLLIIGYGERKVADLYYVSVQINHTSWWAFNQLA